MFCRCRWKGLPAAHDSWMLGTTLYEDCPGVLIAYYQRKRTVRDDDLQHFIAMRFPNEKITLRARNPDNTQRANGRNPKRRRGRPPKVIATGTRSARTQNRGCGRGRGRARGQVDEVTDAGADDHHTRNLHPL